MRAPQVLEGAAGVLGRGRHWPGERCSRSVVDQMVEGRMREVSYISMGCGGDSSVGRELHRLAEL